MSDNRSWSSIGEEIRNAVEQALITGDFSKIGDVAASSVSDTMKNVGSMVEQAVNSGRGGAGGSAGGNGAPGAPGQNGRSFSYTQQMSRETRERQRRQAEAERLRNEQQVQRTKGFFLPIGRVSSVLYNVFGGIGIGVMSILMLVFGGIGLFSTINTSVPVICFAVGLIASVIMINVGINQNRRLKRAKKYFELSGNNHYINLEDLALHTNASVKAIRKDLRKMIRDGFFPQGHLDKQETCLILDDKIYREYLALEKQRAIQERERTIEQKVKADIAANAATQAEAVSDLDKMIAEGQECIRKLRDMNDNIAGEEISAKLFRLENLLKEIFERLKEHPEQMPQMKKFMSYYLPTTLKLVAAYEEFDSVSDQGDDIQEAKAEIEKTLDTINDAFVELLNRLFRDTAYDVTTDAQVLQTMLEQEGLTKRKDFTTIPN